MTPTSLMHLGRSSLRNDPKFLLDWRRAAHRYKPILGAMVFTAMIAEVLVIARWLSGK